MSTVVEFLELSPTTLADCLAWPQIMYPSIRAVWSGVPRVAGPAYTVRCGPGDHLMLHAAIYRAPVGSVIVVEAQAPEWALAGGNVCAAAQKRGVLAFVLDGLVRDVAEIRGLRFPVFAKGVIPKPGTKAHLGSLETRIQCGGVAVDPGDIIVADEEGIVVVPVADRQRCLDAARERARADSSQSLTEWEIIHRQRIDDTLSQQGFTD